MEGLDLDIQGKNKTKHIIYYRCISQVDLFRPRVGAALSLSVYRRMSFHCTLLLLYVTDVGVFLVCLFLYKVKVHGNPA